MLVFSYCSSLDLLCFSWCPTSTRSLRGLCSVFVHHQGLTLRFVSALVQPFEVTNSLLCAFVFFSSSFFKLKRLRASSSFRSNSEGFLESFPRSFALLALPPFHFPRDRNTRKTIEKRERGFLRIQSFLSSRIEILHLGRGRPSMLQVKSDFFHSHDS